MSDYIVNNVKKLANEINIDKRRSIGDIAKELGIEAHVIRFWETKFDQIKPEIGRGKRRYYRKKDVELIKKIKHYLYDQGYTIVGLQKLFKNKKSRNKSSSEINSALDDIAKTFSSPDLDLIESEEDYDTEDNQENNIAIEDFIKEGYQIKTNSPNIHYDKEILELTTKIHTNLAKLKSLL